MSYVVLARKYRPPNFDSLVGQEHVVQALVNALTQARLHHAYLFTGTRGVGKTTISRILAKSLNCTGADGQGGITARPCGACNACRDIDAGRFIDYVELDAASNRGVDEITQLLDQAVYKPVLGRFKVYMVDEVHMLTTHAFNAMLKTLEEPPDYLKFVLATTDPQKVPATVLSRCLQFNLRPMPPQTVQAHLQAVLAQEAIAAEPGALRLLSRAARGSMRDALSLTDQAIAFGAGRLDEAGVRQMLGAVDRGQGLRIFDALVASDGPALVAAVDGLRALGLSAAGLLEDMAEMLQQMAVLQAVPDAADPADADTPALLRLAALLPADELQLFYSMALHGRAELALAPDEYGGLVMVLLRLLAFRPPVDGTDRTPAAAKPAAAAPMPVHSVASAPVAVSTDTSSSASANVPAASSEVTADAPAAAPPKPSPVREVARPAAVAPPPAIRVAPRAEPPPWLDVPFDDDELAAVRAPAETSPQHDAASAQRVGPTARPSAASSSAALRVAEPSALGVAEPATPGFQTSLGDRWAAVVRRLQDAGAINALVRELAIQSECVAVDDAETPPRWRLRVDRETLRAPAHVDKLQAALAEALGHAVTLTVELGGAQDTPARRDAAERARRQAEAEHTIHNDPLVKALLAQYQGARIVPGSIKPH